jgi:(p)ppGpp synthase/HD superfamily hydrolase
MRSSAGTLSLTEIRRLAELAHEGQIDPDGVVHFAHVRRVADADGFEETAVALLHDVLEDTDLRETDLRRRGISDVVVEAVELLTHAKETPYEAYLDRIGEATGPAAELARTVKTADVKDNLRRSEAAGDRSRIAKYSRALRRLQEDSKRR